MNAASASYVCASLHVILTSASRLAVIQVTYQAQTRVFRPEEISSMVLGKMRDVAESFTGEKVTDAVVTGKTCNT